jgi:hypothetical protein
MTKFINSPPGVLAAGGVLAGIVWKAFERVEAVLTDQTKFEIAVWLVGVRVSQRVEPWPDTFAKVFEQAFGRKYLSWKCIRRSLLASTLGILFFGTLLVYVVFSTNAPFSGPEYLVLLFVLPVCLLLDYFFLFKTRLLLQQLRRHNTVIGAAFILCVDGVTNFLGLAVLMPFALIFLLPNLVSSAIGSIWLWLYVGSSFIIKAARHFDVGFAWFNRKFDVEKKPLQCIGLVSGAIVAIVYWVAVILRPLL